MSVIIRSATKQDAELISELSRKTFFDTFASQNTKENMEKFLDEQFTKESLIHEVGSKGNEFLLAFIDQEPVGYLRLRENNSPPELQYAKTLEIARIYVVKKYIGKGVGKILMQKSIDIAKKKKVDTIWLGVWEHNQLAINFYNRWGFKKFTTHVFMLGNDAQIDWLMKRDIVAE